MLTKGRRPQPAQPIPSHTPTQPEPNISSSCLTLPAPKHQKLLTVQFPPFFSHCRSLGLPSSILEKGFRGYFALQKNNYLISLIPNYYAQAYLRKRIRFSLFFGGCTSEQGDEFECDTLLSSAAVKGVLHMDELGEERAQ